MKRRVITGNRCWLCTVPPKRFYLKSNYSDKLNLSLALPCNNSSSLSLNLNLSCFPLLAETFIAVLLRTLRCEMLPVAYSVNMACNVKKPSLCMEKPFSLQGCVGVQGFRPISFSDVIYLCRLKLDTAPRNE